MKYLFAKAYSVVKKWGYCQPPSRTSHKSLPFQCQLLQIRKSKKLRKNLEKNAIGNLRQPEQARINQSFFSAY